MIKNAAVVILVYNNCSFSEEASNLGEIYKVPKIGRYIIIR